MDTLAQAQNYMPKQPSGWGKLWAAFGLAFAVLLVQVIFTLIGLLSNSDDAMMAIAEIGSGVVAILFIFALGGKKLSAPSMEGFSETWQIIKWIFITDAIIACIEIASLVYESSFELAQLWPLRVLILFLLCAGIGLFEETMFRGLIFQGLLSRMGTNTKGILWAAILSSLFFGMMHINLFEMDWTDPSQVIQAILKTAQAGIFGFAAAGAVLKTGNIWPIAFFHAANDFMLMLMTNGLMSNPVTTEYVSEGADGLFAIGIYLLLCIAYTPAALAAWRTIRDTTAPNRGQFYRGRSYAPAPVYGVPGYAAPAYPAPGYPAYSAHAYPAYAVAPQYAAPQASAVPQGYVAPQAPAPQPYPAPQAPANPSQAPANPPQAPLQ